MIGTMARKYFGRVYATKSYRGPKSVNLVVAGPIGVELAIAILKAAKNAEPFDLAIHDMGEKEGPVLVTVTARK